MLQIADNKGILSNLVFKNVLTGLIVGIYTVILCISFATLFSFQQIATYVPQIIGLYLFGVAVAMIITALFSSHPLSVANPHNTYTAIMVVIALQIVNLLLGSISQIFPTICAAIALTSLLTGICFLIFSYFRLGKIIRYVPYPVIGGFLASVGWIIFSKAVQSVMGPMTENDIVLLIAMLLFAVTAVVLEYRYKNSITLIYLFVAAIFIFYLVLYVKHISIAAATKAGWLMNTLQDNHLWELPKKSFFSNINWEILLQVSSLIAVVIFVCIMTFFLNSISVEMETKKKMHFNHELLVAGFSNIFSGAVGGVVAYPSLPTVVLAKSMGGTNQIVGLVGGGCCLLTLLIGAAYINYLPKFALLGVLVFTAFNLLIKWLYQAYFRLNKQDYLILVIIFLTIVLFGFIEGVFAGIILSMIFFVINYSKVNVIKYSLTGEYLHSNKLRSPQIQKILQRYSEHIAYFKLQGYIFFGTAYSLLRQIRHETNKENIKYIILNFSLVYGLDSSAIQYFSQFDALAREKKLTIIFANVSKGILKKLKQEDIINDQTVRIFGSVDYALEWCEDSILKNISLPRQPLTFIEQLTALISSEDISKQLFKYFTEVPVVAGECIIQQGEESAGLYFLESGEVSVIFKHPYTHAEVRLRKMGAGNIVGEIGLYTKARRAASIIADKNCVLYHLSEQNLHEMEQKEPALAIAFHKLIVVITAERLVYKDHQLEELGIDK